MREIKFRVWHTKSNQWHPYPGGLAVRINDGVLVTAVSDKLLSPVSSEFICQQFTGLKDKNGVDIYEGDIVKRDAEEGDELIRTGDVFFDDDFGSYQIGINGGRSGRTRLVINYGYYGTWCEVIGNIYENPELLGESK